MVDVRKNVLNFAVQADRAKGHAREAYACLDGRDKDTGLIEYSSEKLKLRKNDVLEKWIKAVKGTVHRPTLFGSDAIQQSNLSDLFDALVATLTSKADPPNDAELVSFCEQIMPVTPITPQQLQDTIQVMLLFEEAALNVLTEGTAEVDPESNDVRIDLTLQRALLRGEHCLKIANNRNSREGQVGVSMLLAEAWVAYGEARETLLEAMDHLRSLVPKTAPFQGVEDVTAIKKMQENALEIQTIAGRVQILAGKFAKGTTIDKAAAENKRQDIRTALVSLLRSKNEELSDRWLAAIPQRVAAYRRASGAGQESEMRETSAGGQEEVSKSINKRLVDAMIERMRPNGDGAALVYAAQNLVEKRFKTMNIHSVQAATRLFEDVCMELFHELVAQGPYSKDLLPLITADDTDIRSMLTDVIFLANKLIISEYNIRYARGQDPRLPGWLLVRGPNPTPHEVKARVARIAELLIGAEIAGQYRLDTYIMGGGFGHGWLGTDLQSQKPVFVKVFKTVEEFGPGSEAVVAKMVEELETGERIKAVKRLMNHRNVVSVQKVPRNATINVPSTNQKGDCFHGIVTEYCDGGELFNYIVLPKEGGGLQGCAFNEKQARFLFKQIVALLMVLHHPAEGEGEPYYHGDIKDQNFVVAGTTLKLIDYGTLSKVKDNIGPVKHMTRTHQQPFHNNCESVDLWAAGIILLDMLLISTVGQVFKMSMGQNAGVSKLKAGVFWDKLHLALKTTDKTHCLLESGPNSVKDLLQQIFVMEPPNSLSVKKIAAHPWLQGEVPSEAEMETELRRRYKGILQGTPPGTAFFDLGRVKAETPEGEEMMKQVIDLACRSSNGEFVKGGPGKKANSIYIHRWDRPAEGREGTASYDPAYTDEAQWVVAKYLCNVEESDFDICKGRCVTRLRLFWESGSHHEDFYRLSGLLLDAVMKLRA